MTALFNFNYRGITSEMFQLFVISRNKRKRDVIICHNFCQTTLTSIIIQVRKKANFWDHLDFKICLRIFSRQEQSFSKIAQSMLQLFEQILFMGIEVVRRTNIANMTNSKELEILNGLLIRTKITYVTKFFSIFYGKNLNKNVSYRAIVRNSMNI